MSRNLFIIFLSYSNFKDDPKISKSPAPRKFSVLKDCSKKKFEEKKEWRVRFISFLQDWKMKKMKITLCRIVNNFISFIFKFCKKEIIRTRHSFFSSIFFCCNLSELKIFLQPELLIFLDYL